MTVLYAVTLINIMMDESDEDVPTFDVGGDNVKIY